MTCTPDLHALLKRDLSSWLTLDLVGIQDTYDGRGTTLELRNAPCCGTTLARAIRRAFTLDEVEAKEREIAKQHRIAWDRVDRTWIRSEALKELNR